MSTAAPSIPLPQVKNARIGIVVATWNSEFTYALRDGAIAVLREQDSPTTPTTSITFPEP